MNTVADIKEYLKDYDDDENIVFAVMHKDDEKYLKRSIENNVGICFEHPIYILQAIAGGLCGDPKNLTNTIFLIQ